MMSGEWWVIIVSEQVGMKMMMLLRMRVSDDEWMMSG